jgi:hypothetical protein
MPLKSRVGCRQAELRSWPAFIHILRIRTERGRTKIGQNRRPPEPSGSQPDLGRADRRRHYPGALGRSKFKVRIVGQSGRTGRVRSPRSATHMDVGNTRSCREHDWWSLRPERKQACGCAACGVRSERRRDRMFDEVVRPPLRTPHNRIPFPFLNQLLHAIAFFEQLLMRCIDALAAESVDL